MIICFMNMGDLQAKFCGSAVTVNCPNSTSNTIRCIAKSKRDPGQGKSIINLQSQHHESGSLSEMAHL